MKKTFLSLVMIVSALVLLSLFSRLGGNYRDTQAQDKTPEKGDSMKEITLPTAKITGQMSLEEAIQKRKSVRKYSPKELTSEQVAQILWAANGANPRKNFVARNVPSAGGVFPMTVYLLDKNGIYRYQPLNHSLALVKEGDKRKELSGAALGQAAINQAPVDLVITADVAKCAQRYGERAQRYTDIEAGHIGQNVSLEAVSLGLGTVMIGAFDDEAVKDVLALPDNESPLYIIPVGYAGE
ncbi:MAG TPA: SagB/ThcOx family dehydrogenase [Planctomycetota bacterium]|nr:SagB/ThcOx family dehydrogenase [Planctomycetota bacterium]